MSRRISPKQFADLDRVLAEAAKLRALEKNLLDQAQEITGDTNAHGYTADAVLGGNYGSKELAELLGLQIVTEPQPKGSK